MPRDLLWTFAATRVALLALATFAVLRLPINPVEAQGFHVEPQATPVLEAWARYDAAWFVAIAEDGYRGPIGAYGDMRPGFFPLFPLVVTLVTQVVGTEMLAGLLVSNVSYLIFLLLLWRIVTLDYGPETARRTVWVYLFFPSAIFLTGVYSESLLLALSTGALLAARRHDWLLAGCLGGLAMLARPVGFVIIPALVMEVVAARLGRTGDWKWAGPLLGVGPATRSMRP